MKTLIIILALALSTTASYAQCEKNVVLKFNEITEIRDAVRSTLKVNGTFTFRKDKIVMKAERTGGNMIIDSEIRAVLHVSGILPKYREKRI
jgi:ribosomal protein S5